MTWQVIEANCVEAMKDMDEASVDAVVTDPPAGISFMGRGWDSDRSGGFVAWLASVMEEALRVTKPGGHALVWALPRTSHWTGSAIEAAGWEIRDRIAHHFGSGFPKSHNLGNGFGTALKPATEDWWLARKPLVGTVAQTVSEFGTGALNIAATRIGGGGHLRWSSPRDMGYHGGTDSEAVAEESPSGRWPPNVALSHAEGCVRVGERRVKPVGATAHQKHHGKGQMLNRGEGEAEHPGYRDADGLETVEAWSCVEGCPVRELDRQSGESLSAGGRGRWIGDADVYGGGGQPAVGDPGYGDTGGASRFVKTVGFSIMDEWPQRGERSEKSGIKPANTSAGKSTESTDSSSPTDGSGSKPTDQSQLDTTSTTGMGTRSTTTSPTSKSSSAGDTSGTTERSEQPLSSGTESGSAPGVASGNPSANTPSERAEPAKQSASSASANTSESGEPRTASTGTPTTVPIESGTEPRFRYQAKASRAERNAGLEGFEERGAGVLQARAQEEGAYLEFTHPQPDDVRAWIRERRLAAGYTDSFDLTEAITGKRTGTVANWEAGVSRPTVEQWQRFRELVESDDRYDAVMTEQHEVDRELFDGRGRQKATNHHPTVKPVDLMRWLVRLVTPPDGTVLDPFAGSGTTGIACVLEDFDFIGLERESEYCAIAEARIDYWAKQPKQLGLLDAA